MTETERDDLGNCATCGEKLHNRFCHKCGEKKLYREDFTVKKFLAQSIDILTHFDSKMIKSIYYLLTRPGYLTSEYMSGRRVRYAKPFQLFILLNIVYFLVLNYIGFDLVTNPLNDHMNNLIYGKLATSMVNEKIISHKIPLKQYEDVFYNTTYVDSKLLVLLMIPLFAFACMLIYLTQKKLYYEHLVFATHFFCFVLFFYTFILNIFVYALKYITTYNSGFHTIIDINDTWAAIIVLILFTLYLYLSLKEVYKHSTSETILKTFLILTGLLGAVTSYNFILFLLVYYST